MRRQLIWWEAAGLLWTAVLGTLGHFLYGWVRSPLLAGFVAVNESVWEHMKLLFFPVFLFTVLQVCLLGQIYPNLLAVRAVTLLTGLVLIPVLFYTYTGAFGCAVAGVNVGIFYLAAAGVFLLDGILLRRGSFSAGWQQLAGLIVLWGVAVAMLYWTFYPPHLPLWQDPLTLRYGI